jgi:hypothetical protein
VRYVGTDVHRKFAQLAVVEDGLVRDEGRIGVTPEALRAWVSGLRANDEAALEATRNSDVIANLLMPLGGAGGGVQSVQDPRDRRGEGQDRQGRCADPGVGGGLSLPVWLPTSFRTR